MPLVFCGADVRAGQFSEEVAPNDIAPTLAAILDIEPPSGSAGHVLKEIVR